MGAVETNLNQRLLLAGKKHTDSFNPVTFLRTSIYSNLAPSIPKQWQRSFTIVFLVLERTSVPICCPSSFLEVRWFLFHRSCRFLASLSLSDSSFPTLTLWRFLGPKWRFYWSLYEYVTSSLRLIFLSWWYLPFCPQRNQPQAETSPFSTQSGLIYSELKFWKR